MPSQAGGTVPGSESVRGAGTGEVARARRAASAVAGQRCGSTAAEARRPGVVPSSRQTQQEEQRGEDPATPGRRARPPNAAAARWARRRQRLTHQLQLLGGQREGREGPPDRGGERRPAPASARGDREIGGNVRRHERRPAPATRAPRPSPGIGGWRRRDPRSSPSRLPTSPRLSGRAASAVAAPRSPSAVPSRSRSASISVPQGHRARPAGARRPSAAAGRGPTPGRSRPRPANAATRGVPVAAGQARGPARRPAARRPSPPGRHAAAISSCAATASGAGTRRTRSEGRGRGRRSPGSATARAAAVASAAPGASTGGRRHLVEHHRPQHRRGPAASGSAPTACRRRCPGQLVQLHAGEGLAARVGHHDQPGPLRQRHRLVGEVDQPRADRPSAWCTP